MDINVSMANYFIFSQSMERVIVQNIHNELTPSLRTTLGTVPRWRFIQASLPFVLHATANILHNKWVYLGFQF